MKDNKGRVEFSCRDLLLERGFYWAKATALAYVREGDPVGDWYEAALPGRQAFCMRDVSHQAVGAQILGLETHNNNMLRKFVQNIDASRDFCSFWEITRDNRPAAVDYAGDNDFWYNLPANFDILQACWKVFQWTGDRDYVDAADFSHFYQATVSDYIRAWDKNQDGIPERAEPGSRRGIPTYDERSASENAAAASDLIAIQAAAFDAYASMLQLKGNTDLSQTYTDKARQLRESFDRNWWDAAHQQFHSLLLSDGRFAAAADNPPDTGILPLYYGLIIDPAKTDRQLGRILDCQSEFVEYLSYLPEIFYQYDLKEDAYRQLLRLTDPVLERREYPEIAFAVIAAFTAGLMGVKPLADQQMIVTAPRLPESMAPAQSARMDHVPVFGGEICVEHTGNWTSRLSNQTGSPVLWQAEFDGSADVILVDGQKVRAARGIRRSGKPYVYVQVPLNNGQAAQAEMQSDMQKDT